MGLYLGIDGGGSKTECAIADDRGILGRSRAGSCKIQQVGRQAAANALEAAVRDALAASGHAGSEIQCSCVGMSGGSDPAAAEWVRRKLGSLVGGGIIVAGDHVIAHEAAFRGGAGILVIAGTGSIAYGRNERGQTARAGGWGRTISDEGSGCWIGRTALSATMSAFDSGRKTSLMERLMNAWEVSDQEALINTANAQPSPDFSRLYPEVLKAAESGDALAEEILVRAAWELAQLVLGVCEKLWPAAHALPGEARSSESVVHVAGAGGVMTSSPQIREEIERVLARARADVVYDKKTVDPVSGAIYLANIAANHVEQHLL